MNTIFRLTVASSIFFSITASLCATTLLDETFADGVRTVQNPPTSIAWFASVSNSTTTAVGSVSIAGSTAARQLVGYFPSAGYGSPQTVTPGETMRLSLNFTFTGTLGSGTGNLIRFGVFNSAGGSEFAEDNINPNPLGTGYGGYVASISNAGGEISTSILARQASAVSGALLTNTGAYGTLATATPITASFTTDTTYRLELNIERINATTILLTSIISGGDLSSSVIATYTDFTAANIAFDTIGFTAFGGAAGAGSSLTEFSNIRVDLIPEPSTIACLGLFFAGASFMWFRRQKLNVS